ncbi:AcrR family transcriptional regulator [Prauserella sediminis]|uniref:AcrR family transcriptional regulator n=1 Tax=Prauserella sediminis TaxID=577680 RepID=A0A839XRC5_9PSEU|nr:TetR/AcrR family transcriptional regulator [Prauserella sediminis]MBB3665257.1 AcrR family transcriptional regulator [Prauserella sediminis]
MTAAIEILEAGEAYSMRAVARRAGVSPTAPYRHFADRDALDSAVAVEGFQDLRDAVSEVLAGAPPRTPPVDLLSELGVTYVNFALRRPAVFRLMFGNECDEADSDRVQASQALHALLNDVLDLLFPGQASPELATALWSLAHGLAFLHLDGKYRPEPADEVAARIRASVAAILDLNRA